jgi:hypothetical protein
MLATKVIVGVRAVGANLHTTAGTCSLAATGARGITAAFRVYETRQVALGTMQDDWLLLLALSKRLFAWDARMGALLTSSAHHLGTRHALHLRLTPQSFAHSRLPAPRTIDDVEVLAQLLFLPGIEPRLWELGQRLERERARAACFEEFLATVGFANGHTVLQPTLEAGDVHAMLPLVAADSRLVVLLQADGTLSPALLLGAFHRFLLLPLTCAVHEASYGSMNSRLGEQGEQQVRDLGPVFSLAQDGVDGF